MSVPENEKVEKHVEDACKRAGRKREEVTLIAVSKTKPVSMIEELLSLHVMDFWRNSYRNLLQKQKFSFRPLAI